MTNRRQFIVKASAVLAALLGVKVAAAKPMPEVHGEWFEDFSFDSQLRATQYGILEFESDSIDGIQAVCEKLLGRVNRDEIDGRKPGTLFAESMRIDTLKVPFGGKQIYRGKMKLLYKAEGWNNVLGRQVVDANGNRLYQDVRFSL